jgi:hypothetical protein
MKHVYHNLVILISIQCRYQEDNRNRPISKRSGKNNSHNGPILTGTAKSRGPILTGTNKNNFHATSESGCLSTASTINFQHY